MKLEYSFGISLNWLEQILFYLLQGVIYFLLTLGLEFFHPHQLTSFSILEFVTSFRRTCPTVSDAYSEPLLRSSTDSAHIDLDEDVDVKTERNRVLSGSIDKAIIYLRNLRKVILILHFIFTNQIISYPLILLHHFIYTNETISFPISDTPCTPFCWCTLYIRYFLEEETTVRKLRSIHWRSQFKKESVLVFWEQMEQGKPLLCLCYQVQHIEMMPHLSVSVTTFK